MGTIETYGLYAVAFLVFLYAWRDASNKIRKARTVKSERAEDIARGDRNFAIFAGAYILLIIFFTAKFTPVASAIPKPRFSDPTPRVRIGPRTIRAKALVVRNGKMFVEDEKGNLLEAGKRDMRIEFGPPSSP